MIGTGLEETIVAIATPPGRGGGRDRARVWTGGPRGRARLCDTVAIGGTTCHAVRCARRDGATIDHALVTVFDGPRSFTGE